MNWNMDTAPHYRSEMIHIGKLKNQVFINTDYLKEKPTWYEIEGKLQYFKVRNDLRIFTELFFARSLLGLNTLNYSIAYIRTIDPKIKSSDEESKCGLLSECFQNKNYNHYLVSELQQAEISNFIAYGGYNLSGLLNFFKDTLSPDSYEESKATLIKLFIGDAFTCQADRNPHNIAFQIPVIPNVSYKERLHADRLAQLPEAKEFLEYDSDRDMYLLKDFSPNVIYDSERCLGIDHKNVRTYHSDECWNPLFPFSEDLRFENGKEAAARSHQEFDGLDPNLFSLFVEHQDFCEPYFERLAYDDEYRKILEDFSTPTSPIRLQENELEYFEGIMKDRQNEFQKIMKL